MVRRGRDVHGRKRERTEGELEERKRRDNEEMKEGERRQQGEREREFGEVEGPREAETMTSVVS